MAMSTSNTDSLTREKPTAQPIHMAPADRLKEVRAVILLGGAVRKTNLARGLQRSMLNLPIDQDFSVIEQWGYCIEKLAKFMQRDSLDLRIMVNKRALKPVLPTFGTTVNAVVENDLADFRGTGGVLFDIASDYDDDDYLIVANGAQILMQPFEKTINELAQLEADISLVSHHSGVPSGFLLVRVGALKDIPASGFHDLKEQCLPVIAKNHIVKVRQYDDVTGLSIRTLDDYINALRWYHRQLAGAEGTDPFGEELGSSFCIIEEGAKVDEKVKVINSVILKGANVTGNTVVVRSIIGAGSSIPSGRQIVDQVIRGRKVTNGGAQ